MTGRDLGDVPVTEPTEPGYRDSIVPVLASQSGGGTFVDKPQQFLTIGIRAWAACGLLRCANAAATASALRTSDVNTHVCFDRAIIGTVSVRRSGGGFGESRTPATNTCGSSISDSPWSGNRDAKCASGPIPNMAMSKAGFSPNCQ